MKLKIFAFLFIVSIMAVQAQVGVIQNDNFFITSSGAALTGVEAKLYTCSEATCNSQGALIKDMNSGSTNRITFEYPYNPYSSQGNLDEYAHFFFKDCYLPKEYIESVWGYGVVLDYNYNFNKAVDCHSPIDHFTVTNSNYQNEPVVIDVEVDLEAQAHSAFTDKFLPWFPAGYEDYYSAETHVTLTIKDNSCGNIIYTDYVDLNILQDTAENVQFEWTPTEAGEYTARVTTDVTDCQCSSSFEQYSEKIFSVLPKRPQNDCYTLIQDLTGVPEFPIVGDNIQMTYDKVSNFMDMYYAKTAVPTIVQYEILDEFDNVVYQDELTLPANPNPDDYFEYGFDWTPVYGGHYYIRVTGIADSVLCQGIDNIEDTAILNMYVQGVPQECTPGEIEEKQCGQTDVGVCEFGSQMRECRTDGTWGNWGSCMGAVYPTEEICWNGLDDDCDGLVDENCGVCVPGETDDRQCGVSDIGVCEYGEEQRICDSTGNWGSWYGCDAVFPTEEICDSLDNDCDGFIDEGGVCGDCIPDEAEEVDCGTDVGECEKGTKIRICIDNGLGGGVWGDWSACVGAVWPVDELCDGKDNDCDGETDEDFPDLGEMCDTGVGICRAWGYYVCTIDGTGTECDVVPGEPEEEICDGLDNDCDGLIDEDGVCGPEISGIPDQEIDENSGLNNNLVFLPDYASDPDDDVDDLIYTIIEQTQTDIVDCVVDSGNFIDCTTMQDMFGASQVTVMVSDGTDSGTDTFEVVVGQMNTPPTISIPDYMLPFNSGFHDNMIDLWIYADDRETIDQFLDFTIVSQSNPEIVECVIDSEQFIDCLVMPDMAGTSYVTIQVSDGELTAEDTFRVTVQEPGGDIYVEVLYPNGGELLKGTVDILWNAFSTHECIDPESIMIEYSKDAGLHWVLLADDEKNDGIYAWDTTKVENQARYLIKVTATDCIDSASDTSDGIFAVSNRKPKKEEEILGDYRLNVFHITLVEELINPKTDDLRVLVSIQNTGDFDLEDVKVTAVIPDLAVRDSFGPFDMDDKKMLNRDLFLDIPDDAVPGEYPIRFTFSNSNVKRVKYRFITIVTDS